MESRTQGSRPRTQKNPRPRPRPRSAFRGQNLSRPKTAMLEAKAKDQEHRRKRSPKEKKRSSKFFFMRSPIYWRTKNFWLGEALTTNHMKWRHQIFSKEEVFVGQRYRRMEHLKSLLPVCMKPGFCKGRGLKLLVEKRKYPTFETCWESLCNSNVLQMRVWERGPQPPEALGVWGQSPQLLGDFL